MKTDLGPIYDKSPLSAPVKVRPVAGRPHRFMPARGGGESRMWCGRTGIAGYCGQKDSGNPARLKLALRKKMNTRLDRIFRRMRMPRKKKRKLKNRYFRLLTRHLGENHPDYEGLDARRRLQLRWNKNEES